jgi:hypothetical protein
MSKREEPVFEDGKLIGWNVTVAPEYADVSDIAGLVSERICTRAGGRFFVPCDINGRIEGERK